MATHSPLLEAIAPLEESIPKESRLSPMQKALDLPQTFTSFLAEGKTPPLRQQSSLIITPPMDRSSPFWMKTIGKITQKALLQDSTQNQKSNKPLLVLDFLRT